MVFPSLRNIVEGVLIAPKKVLTQGTLLIPHPEGTLLTITAASVSVEDSGCICHLLSKW